MPWRDVEEPVLPPPSVDEHTALEVIKMRMQAYDETLNKILDAHVGKSGCMSLTYRFMKLVRRGNNLKKETLIDLPYIL